MVLETNGNNPNHSITLENTNMLLVEHKWFVGTVKWAIHIRALNPSLNRDSTRYNLPPVWNNIIKERLTDIFLLHDSCNCLLCLL